MIVERLFGITLLKHQSFPLISNLYSKILPYPCFTFCNSKTINNKNSHDIITYTPIRPLKKHLTPLYAEKQYLNKGRIQKQIPFWPYLTPFYAILINNFLTSWNFLNTTLATFLFIIGFIIRQSPNSRRMRQIIKFQCNNDLTKLYMTILYSGRSIKIANTYKDNYKGFQDWNIFSQEQLKNNQYVPTQADKRTYTQQELEIKKQQFDAKLLQKILKQRNLERTISRFELDAQKTVFKLSDDEMQIIEDHEIILPEMSIKMSQIDKIPYKFLIVRTQFLNKKKTRPYHFFIDLQKNGDLRYQDYLVALGANYKISLGQQTKK